VWLVCPSARPVEHVAKWAAAWRERGYEVAILRNDGQSVGCTMGMLSFQVSQYRGYAVAVNYLIDELIEPLFEADPGAEWFIAAGDDIFPDPDHTAGEIAKELDEHFGGTYGVCQPTGDRYGEERRSPHPLIKQQAYIDRVAGSAWIGREFCQRAYNGKGPLWHEYFHNGVDEELQELAIKLGVFWQRPDLIHRHDHWARERGTPMPDFLIKANAGWDDYKKLFAARKAAGFPDYEVK
jgi:hypothetical protein